MLFIVAILALLAAKSGGQSVTMVKKKYQIAPESKLYLKGTTNVNTFTCDCTDEFPGSYLEVESQGDYARFQNTGLCISTRNFNCHNRKIETDMQQAMKAETYPYIRIELAETWQNAQNFKTECKDWFPVKAKVRITITNVTKEHQILGKAKKIGANQFQLLGEKALQMTEFGIDPPHAMFGMIKVNDWITFHFDLIVKVEE